MAVADVAPQFYLDEKWKLSKKEGSRSTRSTTSSTSPLIRNSSQKSPLTRNSSQRRCSFSRKCASLVKEQRARFYIMRRCVTMLVCWREYGDS
ncbi:small polypeptide DEVIL 11-like [Macadamia integrifolia]|uniref:small polypeptide DEVIL 11-like n=1 Tax=Macadamia integrifolia TaxID=60698 RepID=UPI001C52D53A|nr:small polypeptide DEVIL 11-like [Macadamia integrifolia]